MNSIVVENISKKFKIPRERKLTLFQNLVGLMHGDRSFVEMWALRDVSFEVKQGETLGIIGRNGSGKSTLLKILANVLYPDSGKLTIDGKVAPFLELGVGFQPELTAEENVIIYSSILGIGRRETKSNMEGIFEFAELQRFRNMKLKNYSSGMYLRLAFATAIHAKPDTLLIDEVFAVGDEAFQKKCTNKINEFRSNGKTIIFVSHSLDAIRHICDQTILLDKGMLISLGSNEKVIQDYLNLLENQ